jgi:8-oxo-dGTP pyrophosphatase MutT (NUDIX family)
MRYPPRALLYKLLYRIVQVYWFVFRPQVRGVRCLIEDRNRFLLIRQTYGDMRWTLPGGLIKRGETPEQAVRREVGEEVGLELLKLRFLNAFLDTGEYARDTVHCFWGKSSSAEVKIDRDEIYEARWFAIEDLPDHQSRQLTRVLDLYFESNQTR